MIPHIGQSDYHGLQTSFTKRMSQPGRARSPTRCPASGIRIRRRSAASRRFPSRWRRTWATNGRWRKPISGIALVFNGIWQVGKGFQVSGIYFYGSGQRTQAVCGCDARGLQITSIDRLRLDGTIIPREAFVGEPIHRVEVRLQQRVPLGGSVALSGYAEVFNLFNHANYGYCVQRHRNQPDVRAASIEHESVVRAADRATGVQAYVLNES